MGDSTFAHPCLQAFALPQLKDKQRSQPTPSVIILRTAANHSNHWNIIHPRRRFVALSL